MILFSDDTDKALFLLECGKSIHEEDTPTDHKSFIHHRSFLVPLLKDFRKSQQQKHQWRTNKNTFIKGIKDWHSSTSGKRFHRKLGIFLATRDREHFSRSLIQTESCELNNRELLELKCFIENELRYYQSIDNQVLLECILEDLQEAINANGNMHL